MDDTLALAIMAKHAFKPQIKIKLGKEKISDLSGQIMELSEQIHERREIQNGEQPENIADALMVCKEQMLVRDNYKPEHFLKDFGLDQDDETFGFVNQTKKNRLTKVAINLFFTTGSNLFYEYFKSRVSVVSTEISGLSRKRSDADQ
jgi:hypothetical protein